jgi:hypothetical protein
VTFAETGSILLGPVFARGDLRIEAGANGSAAGGTTGAASIIQTSAVEIANTAVSGANAASANGVRVTRTTGAMNVRGDTVLTTGLKPSRAIDAGQARDDRNLVLANNANVFGGDLTVTRITGNATIVEESTAATVGSDGFDQGVLRIRNFEVGGSASLTTTDDVVFVGRMTSLSDSVENPDRVERPTAEAPRIQSNLNIADDDLRLFVSTGETFTIDTTGGGILSQGGDVRFDRPVDGDNNAPSIGSGTITAERANLGGLIVNAGTNGEVRFRDFVGATNPLGAVDITGGDFFAGFTFASDEPVNDLAALTPVTRFLFDAENPDDFFFSGPLRINVGGTLNAAVPALEIDNFITADEYFGINVSSFNFGDTVAPQFASAFGFIINTRQRAGGLLPVGPRSSDFLFNDCVIGDVADCTSIPTPNVVNTVLIVSPTLLGVSEEDLLELFGSFGNEELWGVPQSFFSDIGDDQDLDAEECDPEVSKCEAD